MQTYVRSFDSTWSNLIHKQDRFPLQEYRERSILTTWKISYEQVLRQSEAAAWLLRLWAFFYYDDLWYGLLSPVLTATSKGPMWLVQLAEDELEFSDAIGLLVSYSLVYSRGTGSYGMHPVLHRWSRSMSSGAEAAALNLISIYSLGSAVLSEDDNEYWILDRRLLQHVLHALYEMRMSQMLAKQERPGWVLNRLGDLLRRQVKLDDAEQMYQQALASKEKELGTDHMLTLSTVNDLGNLYSDQGKLDRAEQMYQRALAGFEKALGFDHMSTLDSVNNLGLLYRDQGKPDEAEQMYQRALAGFEKVLGPDHKSTLVTVFNLGLLYGGQGKLDKAEQMCQRALAGFEEALGSDHILTLKAVEHLSGLYANKGKLDEAEQMYRRVLAGYGKAFGPNHKSTLSIMNDLGLLYRCQGRLDEAEQMYQRALSCCESIYESSHKTVTALSDEIASIRVARSEFPYHGRGVSTNRPEQLLALSYCPTTDLCLMS